MKHDDHIVCMIGFWRQQAANDADCGAKALREWRTRARLALFAAVSAIVAGVFVSLLLIEEGVTGCVGAVVWAATSSYFASAFWRLSQSAKLTGHEINQGWLQLREKSLAIAKIWEGVNR